MKNINDVMINENTDWYYISCHKTLSESFIETHSNKLNWYNISEYQTLSEQFIETHSDKVDWTYISICQKLSEQFIEKHSDKLNWGCISTCQNLSEDFIEKHTYKLNWRSISEYQKLSDDFIKKHIDLLSIEHLCQSQYISDEMNSFLKLPFECVILASEYQCGMYKRNIYIYKEQPDIIHIGCFSGTQEEAIESVKKKYSRSIDNHRLDDYISKINKCFKDAKLKLGN